MNKSVTCSCTLISLMSALSLSRWQVLNGRPYSTILNLVLSLIWVTFCAILAKICILAQCHFYFISCLCCPSKLSVSQSMDSGAGSDPSLQLRVNNPLSELLSCLFSKLYVCECCCSDPHTPSLQHQHPRAPVLACVQYTAWENTTVLEREKAGPPIRNLAGPPSV